MFDMHMLNDSGKSEMRRFKSDFAKAVKAAADLMPEGREKALFTTKLEEAVFFGAKAIAGKPGNYTDITTF